ncbi:carboxypeptidase-like regulatory domain-containing protein [Haladaptatus caseinilyticus]|uniref:carboxypeptidase-like regulatory domain-containing protein n=1 Tax=Haladaptatus caseinilyticus TaxID=2993314 RepID=UPI00224B5E75|nr:carboxypeptidase-like regulatory domain-containing protein [Haladaptatus caseinilyticus]
MPQISASPKLVLLILLLAITGFSTPALGGFPTHEDIHTPNGMLTPQSAQQSPETTNNSSQPRHRDPSKVQSEEELSELEQWMAGQLGSRLGDSTVKLNQGEYQSARSVVGDQYNDMLSKYVDVSGRTKSTKDDKRAKQFKRTSEDQKEYAENVSEYRQTYKKYQQAKENGNDEKARQLARQLQNSSDQIDNTGQSLTQNYQNLSNTTNTDFTEETNTVEEINSNISDQQAEIRAAEFSQTEISAEVESDESSFLDPVTVSGELVDENGTELENETIQIQLGENRTQTTTTDEDGDFTITGRPTILSLGEQSVTIRHVPKSSSIYLGSNTTVNTTIQQVRPSVTISQKPKQVQFNKSFAVTGRVSAENVGAGGVPVVITIGNTVLGDVKTGPDGRFSLSKAFPKSVLNGQQQIHVLVPLRDRALARTTTKAPLSVQSTNTTVNLSAQALDQRNISVHGNLTTVTGVAIPNETIVLRSNGMKVGTVTTDANGTYDSQIRLPAKLAEKKEKSELRLSASYAGKGTNLKPSSATANIQFDSESLFSGSTLIWFGIIGLLGFIAMSGFAIRRSDLLSTSNQSDEIDYISDEEMSESNSDESEVIPEVTASMLVNRAKTALSEEQFQTSIETAYAAGRHYFMNADESILEDGQTHWEFYRLCQNRDFTEDQLEGLHELTQLYEQATFTTRIPSRKSAKRAVEIVSTYDIAEGGSNTNTK